MITRADKTWILPALGAMLVWGFWAFLPKIALQTLPPYSIIFYEALGNFLVVIPILFHLRFKVHFEAKVVLMVGMSSALTALAILSYFIALHNGPVAVVVTLTA
ncbi:MAG TPA: EamA family transporter, partial [Patescibacteria group bacterium]|nr:EamA family transporter [Patescibacteria group bacterium]